MSPITSPEPGGGGRTEPADREPDERAPYDSLAPSPIVVLGPPESGATYLTRLLNEHPEILLTRDTRLFVWLNETVNVLPRDSRYVRNERSRFIKHLRATLPELVRGYYRELRDETKPTARHWGDETPRYSAPRNRSSLKVVSELFPESRYIHVVRDGRDVVTSILRKGWAGFEAAHNTYTNQVSVGHRFGTRLGSGRYFEVRHEDLVADDEEMAGRIFRFLGLTMTPTVTDFCRTQARERSQVQEPTPNLADGTHDSEWNVLLAPYQQIRSLELLRDTLVAYGYETEDSIAQIKATVEQRAAAAPEDPLRQGVAETIPTDATVLVATGGDDRLLLAMDGRRAWHFPQLDRPGQNLWREPPGTSEEAVSALESVRARGGEFLVFPASQLWWRDKYEDFHRHLESRHRLLLDNPHCLVYELRGSPKTRSANHGNEATGTGVRG